MAKKRSLFVAIVRGLATLVLSALPVSLLVVGIVGGWALLTWGVADLLVPEVWTISAGLFLLSLAGWRFLWTLFGEGLYKLSMGKSQRSGRNA